MKQTTLASSSSWIEGYSLTRHDRARVRFLPAPPHAGVVFRVTDGAEHNVKCDPRFVAFMHRWTSLVDPPRVINHTEHILAALSICGIDNVQIEMGGNEIPLVSNGSSRAFVDELRRVGVETQGEERDVYRLKDPFCVVGEGDHVGSCLMGYPAPEWEISYMFHVPGYAGLQPVVGTCCPSRGVPDRIIDARTYLLEHEMEAYGALLHEKVQHMLVVGPSNGPDSCQEAAHHKLLDLMGDLRCLGLPVMGRFIGIRSGHRLNIQAVKHMTESHLLEKVST